MSNWIIRGPYGPYYRADGDRQTFMDTDLDAMKAQVLKAHPDATFIDVPSDEGSS